MQIFVNNEKEQVEFESTTYLPTSGWMLDGANLAGDSGAAGGEALKGVLVVGGDRGRCFSMTCDWNASMETHESPQAEQYMTGGVWRDGARRMADFWLCRKRFNWCRFSRRRSFFDTGSIRKPVAIFPILIQLIIRNV
jgi:hypothetical protein